MLIRFVNQVDEARLYEIDDGKVPRVGDFFDLYVDSEKGDVEYLAVDVRLKLYPADVFAIVTLKPTGKVKRDRTP